MTLELPRRRFLLGLGALVAAPAVVRAASLMPVRAAPLPFRLVYVNRTIRSREEIAYLEIINRKIAETFIHGSQDFDPVQFQGFKSFYDLDRAGA